MKRESDKSHVKYEKVNDFIGNVNLCEFLECLSKGFWTHDVSLDNVSLAVRQEDPQSLKLLFVTDVSNYCKERKTKLFKLKLIFK